jgi:hypothetical protein
MALRLVMPLRNIVDQILMERWRERQPIVRANRDCDCCVAPYRRGEGYCGEPAKVFRTRRPLHIHYDRGLSNAERYAAFMRHAYDENEAVAGEGYAISGDSFDPSMSSSSSVERHREQCEEADYRSSMPSKPAHYMSDEDKSNDSGNGFENLARNSINIYIQLETKHFRHNVHIAKQYLVSNIKSFYMSSLYYSM